MGSALALATAVLHPDRVRSVTAAMGGPMRTVDTLRYLKFGMFVRAARIKHPDTDEGAVRTLVDLTRLLASPQHPFDEAWARSAAEISHARAPRNPGSTQRQTHALRATGALTGRMREIAVPTLVVNGADDPLIRPSAAAALARLVPGARPIVYPDMGHLLQQHLWDPLAGEVAALARSTTRPTGPA
jgi:pimeloyl-ACP methyl ester carboxylesterase